MAALTEVNVPVFLEFVTDHCTHLRQGVVDTFDATISARVVGPYREVTFAEGFEHGGCELDAEFKSVVG